jgi:PAS domain-containing protein/DNA-binding CsgD family transcriptional regulator
VKPVSPESESLLVGDIYDAALNPALWPRVLQQVVALTESNSAILTALDQLNPAYTVAFTHNIPAAPLQVYREARLDIIDMELHVPAMLRGGVGSIFSSTEAYGSQEEYIRRAGEFYTRCLAPSNIYYLSGMLVDHGDFRSATLGVHRPRDGAPMGPAHTTLLARLSPHFRRALQIHRQLTEVRQLNAALYRMLDGLVAGVLLLDGAGRVRYANPAAEQALRRHDSLVVTARGELRAADPAANATLQVLLRTAISTGRREGQASSPESVIGLPGPQDGRLLMLTVTPLSELTGYAELAGDGVAAAVFVTDPSARRTLSRRLLQESYGLAERECDLCEAFLNHATLEGTAAACGLSLASVRTYLKGIYDKTGQHSQAELMRLLTGLRLDFEHIR